MPLPNKNYKKAILSFAKKNRKLMTAAEFKLWTYLKNNLTGHKFRRQHRIGKYIADFVCLEKMLVIECDGGQHNMADADKEKNDYLKSEGFEILRFWNNDILNNTEAVMVIIIENLRLINSPSPARVRGRPLPSRER